jgi:hypothetical protein
LGDFAGLDEAQMRTSMPILNSKLDSGELRVIGANYSLDSGVLFFDEK